MPKKLPKITVITPSFNQGNFIEETIKSVLNQNYPNLEYWVFDGGSSDQTIKILKKYQKKLNWVSKKDRGQTDAINKGMKRAKGEIVCYLNSDDVFLPGTLMTVADFFSNTPSSLWVTGDYTIIDANGKTIQPFVTAYKTFIRNLGLDWLLYIANYINQPSTFWRRSVFSEVGYFDQSLRYCMDYDLWLRLVKLQTPHLLPQPLSAFRIHEKSKGGAQYEAQFEEENQVVNRYTRNILLTTLHKLHSTVTVNAYKILK